VGAISNAILPILGVITIITTFMAPYIIRFSSKIKLHESGDKPAEEKPG
jgi:CPA2 family monovalent cation:H+ antiporter-2